MSLSQSQISALYVSIFGRVSEGEGNKFWQSVSNTHNLSMEQVAKHMLDTTSAQGFFADGIETNEKFVEYVYANAFNRGKNEDQEGKAFWTTLLNNGVDKALIASEILKAALNMDRIKSNDPSQRSDFDLLINKIIASNIISDVIQNIPQSNEAIKAFKQIIKDIRPDSTMQDIKDAIASKHDVLEYDIVALERALQENSKTKVLSTLTGKSEEQIQRELDENKPNNPEQPNKPEDNKPQDPKDPNKPEQPNKPEEPNKPQEPKQPDPTPQPNPNPQPRPQPKPQPEKN